MRTGSLLVATVRTADGGALHVYADVDSGAVTLELAGRATVDLARLSRGGVRVLRAALSDAAEMVGRGQR